MQDIERWYSTKGQYLSGEQGLHAKILFESARRLYETNELQDSFQDSISEEAQYEHPYFIFSRKEKALFIEGKQINLAPTE